MAELTDKNQIRAILSRDRVWGAYALADLEPAYFPQCTWLAAPSMAAVALVYRGFKTPVALMFGKPDDLLPVVPELEVLLAGNRQIYFVVRREALGILEPHYAMEELRPMLRMILEPERFIAADERRVERVVAAEFEALQRLFGDGAQTGEAPEWFQPEMLQNGIYYAVRDGRELVAIAGTHVLAPREGVCGLGNIYTRRDRRGCGLGASVTSAVVAEALQRSIETIVLNVNQANVAAIRMYERLGFREYCNYYEVMAVPRNP